MWIVFTILDSAALEERGHMKRIEVSHCLPAPRHQLREAASPRWISTANTMWNKEKLSLVSTAQIPDLQNHEQEDCVKPSNSM